MTNLKICTYCHEAKKLTREHIIPNFYIKRILGITWNHKAQNILKSDPIIKDVCADCNNEILGELDNSAYKMLEKAGLFIDNFTEPYINLEYDYHPLCRWLLKIAFNSERACQDNTNHHWFTKYLPYILGKNKSSNNIIIMAGMFKPYKLTEAQYQEHNASLNLNGNRYINLLNFRITYNRQSSNEYYIKQISIGALCFHILIFSNQSSKGQILTEHLTKCNGLKPLRSSQKSLIIPILPITQLDSEEAFYTQPHIQKIYNKYFNL